MGREQWEEEWEEQCEEGDGDDDDDDDDEDDDYDDDDDCDFDEYEDEEEMGGDDVLMVGDTQPTNRRRSRSIRKSTRASKPLGVEMKLSDSQSEKEKEEKKEEKEEKKEKKEKKEKREEGSPLPARRRRSSRVNSSMTSPRNTEEKKGSTRRRGSSAISSPRKEKEEKTTTSPPRHTSPRLVGSQRTASPRPTSPGLSSPPNSPLTSKRGPRPSSPLPARPQSPLPSRPQSPLPSRPQSPLPSRPQSPLPRTPDSSRKVDNEKGKRHCPPSSPLPPTPTSSAKKLEEKEKRHCPPSSPLPALPKDMNSPKDRRRTSRPDVPNSPLPPLPSSQEKVVGSPLRGESKGEVSEEEGEKKGEEKKEEEEKKKEEGENNDDNDNDDDDDVVDEDDDDDDDDDVVDEDDDDDDDDVVDDDDDDDDDDDYDDDDGDDEEACAPSDFFRQKRDPSLLHISPTPLSPAPLSPCPNLILEEEEGLTAVSKESEIDLPQTSLLDQLMREDSGDGKKEFGRASPSPLASSDFSSGIVVKCHDGPKKVKTRPTSHMALGMNQRRPQSNLVASPPPSTPSCPVRASPSPSPSSPSPVSPSPVSPSSSPSPSSPSFASFSRPMSSEDVESEDDLETFVFDPAYDYEQDDKMKTNVIREICETEQSYIEDLKVLDTLFKTPIAAANLLSPTEFSVIFSNISVIIGIHEDVIAQLASVVETIDAFSKQKEENEGRAWFSEQENEDEGKGKAEGEGKGEESAQRKERRDKRKTLRIGHVFLSFAAYLKMYSNYCINQDKARETVAELMKKNSHFASFVEKAQADSKCRGLLLGSFLIKPVQRLCKYPLFLRELIKYTNDDIKEKNALSAAFNEINASVSSINDSKKQAESLQAMLVLQKEIDNVDKLGLITASRRLLMDTYFFEFESMTNTTIETSSVEHNRWILFNDYLLRTVKKSRPGRHRTLKLGDWLKLKGCQARLIDTSAKVENENGEISTVYGCHLRNETLSKNFFLYHYEKEKRDLFVDLILKALEAARERAALVGNEEPTKKKVKAVSSMGTSAFQIQPGLGPKQSPHSPTPTHSPAHINFPGSSFNGSGPSPRAGRRKLFRPNTESAEEFPDLDLQKEGKDKSSSARILGHRRNKSLNHAHAHLVHKFKGDEGGSKEKKKKKEKKEKG